MQWRWTLQSLKVKRPSPALLVSVIALVLAMAGSAVALPGKDTVGASDIKKGAVRSKQIKDAKVKPWDINKRARFWAMVNASGELVRSSLDGTTATRNDTGQYTVDTRAFKTGPCAPVAQLHSFNSSGAFTKGEVTTKSTGADSESVRVGTFDSGGTHANRGFALYLAC